MIPYWRGAPMTKMLSVPDAVPRLLAPTTTQKIAQRMLAGSREVAAAMPRGFFTPTALDILLILHVAEEDARYLTMEELDIPGGPSTVITGRWLSILIVQSLIDQRGNLLALSKKGYDLVTGIIESVYRAQRALDESHIPETINE